MSLRVVLDTNVFLSGIFWEGNYCSQIINAWKEGKIILISSLEIIEELKEKLRGFKIEMPEDMIEKWQNMIIENAIIVIPSRKLEVVENDPDDNIFFEAAVAGKAQYIVSQDKKHILVIEEYEDVKTIHLENFVKILK